jgi:c-di-GMP-binding flagellar brake protein YcgR
MTGYAYDLAQHKSSRIIEQAARLKAIIWAETLEQPQPRSFSGILVKTDTETLHLQLNQPTLDGTTPMVGQYYQLIISMNDTRYLTVCDLREIQTENSNTFLIFSRPQSLQIMQRRHFHRLTPSQSFPAYVSWQEPEGEGEETKKDNIKTPVLGQVRNLSSCGMSIQVSETLDMHLFIGDTVYVRFSLNVRDPEFFTSASICYKELHMEKSELIIGLQFTNTEENGEFQTRLREALNQNIDMKKGN